MVSVESGFQYRGDLAQTALPEILSTVDRFQVPGVIEASRQGVVKRVYIKEGSVVHASSTDREDSLGFYLERTGVLSPEQFAETMRERGRTHQRYGSLLIERVVLTPRQVYEAIRQQTEAIVWSLFEWQEGSVAFSIGDFREADTVRIQLPMRQVILEGIKRAPNAKAMIARLGGKDTVFEPCYRTEDLIEVAVDAEDVRLLALVNGRRTLYDICAQGPHAAAENGKFLYAFQVLRLIRSVEPGGDAPPEPRTEGGTGAIRIRFKTEGGRYGS
jgi:hypothetical protein